MTGPEHYRESEELLVQAVQSEPVRAAALAAQAQAHATLALAAATVSPAPSLDWARAIGVDNRV